MNAALDIALIDIGAWGLAAIGAAAFLGHRAVDRARLVNPVKQQQDKVLPGNAPQSEVPLSIAGGFPSKGEMSA
jgi:hypothetical protein